MTQCSWAQLQITEDGLELYHLDWNKTIDCCLSESHIQDSFKSLTMWLTSFISVISTMTIKQHKNSNKIFTIAKFDLTIIVVTGEPIVVTGLKQVLYSSRWWEHLLYNEIQQSLKAMCSQLVTHHHLRRKHSQTFTRSILGSQVSQYLQREASVSLHGYRVFTLSSHHVWSWICCWKKWLQYECKTDATFWN